MKEDCTSAYCGLFCESCAVYIASKTSKNDLAVLAEKMNTTVEEMHCEGCKSDRLSPHCRSCFFKSCAREKGLEYCEDCSDFPCQKLMEFKEQFPHRNELLVSAKYRKENGIEKWVEKMKNDYSCPNCGTINSPYYYRCKNCGSIPSSQYFIRNADSIKKHLKIE